jgi:hypothetical protein
MPRWGNLSIGEGIGDAKSYNPMPIVQQYAQSLAENQAKHEQEVKMLSDQLAKGYDPTGLRNDADKKAYMDLYGGIKKDAQDIENEKNPTKKAFGLSGIRQRLRELSDFSAGSKATDKVEQALALEHHKNPYSLSNDAAQKLATQRSAVWNDKSVSKDYSDFERGVDPEKMDLGYNKHVNDYMAASPVTYDNGVKNGAPYKILDKEYQNITQNRVIPFKEAFENTLNYASSNLNFKKGLRDRYPNITDSNPQTELALRTKQYMIDQGHGAGFKDKQINSKVEGYKPPEPTWLERYNLSHYGQPNAPKDSKANTTPLYRQAWINGMLNGEADSGERLQAQIKADPSYNGNLGIGKYLDKKTGKSLLEFHIPEKIAYDKDGAISEKIPARRVEIDPTDPNAKVTLNKLVSDLTTEKVDISALETPGGKKHIGVPGGKQHVLNEQQPNPDRSYKIKGVTYTNKKLIDMGYTPDQIKEAIKLGTIK